MNPPDIVEIKLPICHVEGGGRGFESIEAERLGPSLFRLVCSPGVVEGVAKDDVIELSQADPKGFTVVARSGYLCVWFYFEDIGRNRGPDGDRVRADVEEFGGVCDGVGNTQLVFSVPASVGFPAVEALFDDLAEEHPGSTWMFGNVYDPWNDNRPLRWWE